MCEQGPPYWSEHILTLLFRRRVEFGALQVGLLWSLPSGLPSGRRMSLSAIVQVYFLYCLPNTLPLQKREVIPIFLEAYQYKLRKNGLIMLTVDCVKTICEKITHDLYIETGIECNKRELMLITKVSGFPFPPIS